MIETLATTLLPGEVPLEKTTIHFVDSLDDVLEFKRWVYNETRGRDILAVDTETDGLDPYAPQKRIRLAQFGDRNTAWVVNCEKWPGIAQEVLENYDATPMAFHNIAFDYAYIRACWPDVRFPWERMHDTMLYCRLHDNEAGADLKGVSQKLFGEDAVAGQRALSAAMAANNWTWDTVPMSLPSYTVYSGIDVILTARLWQRLEHIHSGRFRELAEMEMRIVRICSDMSIRGMRVDRAYCEQEGKKLRDYVDQVDETLRSHLGVNPGSTTQLADYFLAQGATLTERTEKGAWSMTKDVLTRLAAEGFEVADAILEMRKASKLAGTYFDNLLEFSDNPQSVIHPKINPIAARTGRMSVSNPSLQNLPSKNSLVRGAFLPREGESIVSCDFSQIELRLTAHITKDPELIAAFIDCDNTGEDFFTRVGKGVYGPAFERSDKRRTLIKNVVYGSSYGAGVPKMAESAKVPVSVMQPIADNIFARYSGIKGIQEMAIAEARMHERMYGRPFIITNSGRRLFVDPTVLYTAANYKVQSYAADLMKKALIRLDNAYLGPYLLLPVHDEVIMSVPSEDVYDVKHAVREAMSITTDMGFAIQIPAEPEGPFERWQAK